MHVTTGTYHTTQESRLTILEMKVNGMEDSRVMQMKISFDLGKIGGHIPSSLGSRLIVVIMQASK